jgi:hypothetical protein
MAQSEANLHRYQHDGEEIAFGGDWTPSDDRRDVSDSSGMKGVSGLTVGFQGHVDAFICGFQRLRWWKK